MQSSVVDFIYIFINEMIVDDLIKLLQRMKFNQFINQMRLDLIRKSESTVKKRENA